MGCVHCKQWFIPIYHRNGKKPLLTTFGSRDLQWVSALTVTISEQKPEIHYDFALTERVRKFSYGSYEVHDIIWSDSKKP